ncbi:DUF4312 family protein [Acidilutibacter cellobiosedens]|jgi:uncharacterized protein (TIGR03578 family)|uniref:DUF4312 family protein n=1 Tax=Acidilutibacter cellobiosedens TaxID=2507161 RepID=A0A410Q907_9FIRM|nr:DUF4312 family protein [Acidilutibacter cellobiosedens]MBE6083320.1 DUF4312 family protein [Tissierellaceae bacterium]QAT60457.1 DUF4312 family protein [Acidilutibacter cellobiosedens]
MEKRQCMKEVEKNLTITAQGNSIKTAYGNIFSILRKKVYSEVEGLIIYMEPLNVYELEVKKHSYTEKFLGLFMPREKNNCEVTAEIVVKIKYIQC